MVQESNFYETNIKNIQNVNSQTFACDKCEKVLPTATALKYHTCADVSSLWINTIQYNTITANTCQRFQCNECNKLFMQKSTLIQHQAVAHG